MCGATGAPQQQQRISSPASIKSHNNKEPAIIARLVRRDRQEEHTTAGHPYRTGRGLCLWRQSRTRSHQANTGAQAAWGGTPRWPVAFRAVPLSRSQDSAYHRTYHKAAVSFVRTWAKTSTTTGSHQSITSLSPKQDTGLSVCVPQGSTVSYSPAVGACSSPTLRPLLGPGYTDPSFSLVLVRRHTS